MVVLEAPRVAVSGGANTGLAANGGAGGACADRRGQTQRQT